MKSQLTFVERTRPMTSGIGKSIKILMGDKMLAQFPAEMADIALAIEKS